MRFLARLTPRSLAARIGVALVLVGLLPIMVVWGADLVEFRKPKAEDQYLLLLADYAAQSVRQALKEGITALETAAQDREVRDHQERRGAVEERLRQFNTLFPLFRHMTLVSLEGQTLASSTYRYRGEWSRLEVFHRANAGETAVSPAHLSVGSPEPMISLATPVHDYQGDRVVGVLVGEIPVASIATLVVGLRVGRGGYAFAVNSVWQVIAHPDAERLMETWDLPGREALPRPTLVIARGGDKDYLYAIAPVAADKMLEEWKVVLRAPTSEAYAHFIRAQRLIMFVAIGMLLVIFPIAAGLALSISHPVRRVIIAARRMAAGEINARASGQPGGELGELSGTFNTMAQELQAKIQALQESRARIVAAQEGVRRSIAAHLHGRVQGRLLALRGSLQELSRGPGLSLEAAQALEGVVGDMGQVIQQDLSTLSHQLYPSILRRGLVPALQSLSDRFESTLAVDMELDEDFMRMEKANRNLVPESVRLAAYRIAEEALTNVVKHASASKVALRLDMPSEGWLRLSVQDNGQGFDPANDSDGLGTAATQDYSEAVGGSCTIHSIPGMGTEVTATLPLSGPDAERPETGSPLG